MQGVPGLRVRGCESASASGTFDGLGGCVGGGLWMGWRGEGCVFGELERLVSLGLVHGYVCI